MYLYIFQHGIHQLALICIGYKRLKRQLLQQLPALIFDQLIQYLHLLHIHQLIAHNATEA